MTIDFVNVYEPHVDFFDDKLPLVAQVARREGSKDFLSTIYLRKHLREQVVPEVEEFWSDPHLDTLFVSGAPGSGKTCFFYLWARKLAAFHKKRVLIVQYRPDESSELFVREAQGGLQRVQDPDYSKMQTVKGIQELLEEMTRKDQTFDLCVFDGLVQNERGQSLKGLFVHSQGMGRINKLIFVASLGYVIKLGQMYAGEGQTFQEMGVESFSQADYVEALSCRAFQDARHGDSVVLAPGIQVYRAPFEVFKEDVGLLYEELALEGLKTDDPTDEAVLQAVIEKKYFFAGGSARFMFQYNIQNLKLALDRTADRIDHEQWIKFLAPTVSPQTTPAVNSLMQQFRDDKIKGLLRCTVLSKYILALAYDRHRDRLAEAVRQVADSTNNPALKGWAFELKQLDIFRSSLTRQVFVSSGASLIFKPTSEATFDGDSILGTVAPKMVIWCSKWNQACFDVAFLREEGILMTIQFTTAEKHDRKLQYVRRLRDAIQQQGTAVNEVHHCFVVGSGSPDSLQVLEASGTGSKMHAREFDVKTYKLSEFVLDERIKSERYDYEGSLVDTTEMYQRKRKADGSLVDTTDMSQRKRKAAG